MTNQAMNVLLVGGTLLAACCALPMTSKYTFPVCTDGSKDCCEYGAEKMKHRGYTLISYEDSVMSVTCSHGELRCALGNPNTMASYDGAQTVTCPDFKSMMESRSEISYIEGVKEGKKKTDDDLSVGTVKPANVTT